MVLKNVLVVIDKYNFHVILDITTKNFLIGEILHSNHHLAHIIEKHVGILKDFNLLKYTSRISSELQVDLVDMHLVVNKCCYCLIIRYACNAIKSFVESVENIIQGNLPSFIFSSDSIIETLTFTLNEEPFILIRHIDR